jgi:hypothetical protein
MKLKALAIAAALSLAPTLALAMGCSSSHATMSCAAGTVYDAASGTCVASATS